MSNVLEVILDLVDNLSPGLDAAGNSVDNLSNAVDSASNAVDGVSDSLSGVDGSNLDDVASSAADAGLDMQQVGEAASMAGFDINSIDPSSVKDTKESAEGASEGLEEAAGAAALLEGALGAIVGVGIVDYLDSAANAAGSRADEWSRLNVNIGGTSSTLEATKSKYTSVIKSIQSVTKRGFGDTLKMLDVFATADITNTRVMENLAEAVSGTTFKLADQGATLDSVTSSVNRMVASGNLGTRQLKALGITTEDLTRVTGMSADAAKAYFQTLDTNGRAAFLATILNANGAAEGNKAYANSWEHLNDALDRGFAAIQRLVGELILPILIPAIEFATGVLEGLGGALNAIPGWLEPIIGAIILVGGAFTSAFLLIKGASGILTALTPILGSLGIEIGGVSGIFGTLAGVLSGPVGWAILAIIGIVLTAIYVWQNWSDEIIAFKNNLLSGNWASAAGQIADSFNYIGEAVWNALVYAGQQIWTFFANLPSMIGTSLTGFYEYGQDVLQWILKGLKSLSASLSKVLTDMLTEMADDGSINSAGETAGQGVGSSLLDGLVQWLVDNWPLIMENLTLLFQQILPLLAQLIVQLTIIASVYLYQAGMKAGMNFINGILLWVMQLPSRIANSLLLALLQVGVWASQMANYAKQSGMMFIRGVLAYIQQLPSRLWAFLLRAAGYILSFGSRAYSYAKSAGQRIVSGITGVIMGLPGKMYSWGSNLISSFVSGIESQFPNVVAALNWIKAHLPSSPPKMGPLSETTAKGWYDWTSSLVAAGMKGFDNFDIGSLNMPSVVGGVSGVGSGNTLNINIDLKNAPSTINEEEVKDMVFDTLEDSKAIKTINKGFNKYNGSYRRSNG